MAKKPAKKTVSTTSPKGTEETRLIRDLAKILDAEGLSEIEMEKGDLRLRVTRQLTTGFASAPLPPAPLAPPTPQSAQAAQPEDESADEAGAVTSPMVGTVYVRPSPDDEPFVKVGDRVKAGQTVLLVEAMKTFNPIKAVKAGTVSRILIEDGQPVEFGEALLVIS